LPVRQFGIDRPEWNQHAITEILAIGRKPGIDGAYVAV
jgi:hypothetical protein